MRRRSALLLSAVGAAAPFFFGASRASGQTNSAPTNVTVVQTTRSVQDWALDVAQSEGMFAANGLHVDVIVAGSSAAVAQQLAAGSADIGSVSTTQVVEAILGGAPLVQILKNVVTSPYTLVGRKGITSVEQLRGKTIMIGGPNDITRVFMDKLLAAHGLHNGDFTYTYAGGAGTSSVALFASVIDATPLLPPVTYSAVSQGYKVLDDTRKYFPNFPTSGYTTHNPWATTHRPVVVAFIKSFLQGVAWLYEPANKTKALQILEETTNTKPDDALRTYEQYMREQLLSRNGRYENGEFAQVVSMLVQTKQIPGPPPPANRFVDDSYADEAARQLKIRGR
jgi:NitT/TauT family transport system substrate-binding protein